MLTSTTFELGGLQVISVQHQANDGHDEQQQQTKPGTQPGSHRRLRKASISIPLIMAV
jgi:hypothetical protein